ncbi:PoNe immunity protein domain-containing protein [Paenibacillus sp. GCM10027626]|uniref:PoNe immunity protein domain-containing protein n=1 Tax=Paenibacillus sp. GCM10027626 TaxID=3273411 RepID=UPI00362D9B98
MRTNIKSKEYFDRFLELELEDISYYDNALKQGEVKEDMIPSVKNKIFKTSLHLFIAKYSSEFPLENLTRDFVDVISRFEIGWKDKGNTPEDDIHFDNYVLVLWMLSLGILLEIEQKDFERIVAVVDNSNRKDYFFDVIISYRIPYRDISTKLSYPDQYGFLKDLMETKDVSAIKKYLDENWYKSMKLTYWYENHKSKHDTFFGYWSFESAVFIKLLGLDDKILQTHEYYPADIAHYIE